MQIRLQDGRVCSGTALQIVQTMRSVAFSPGEFSLTEYMQWVVENTNRFEGATLTLSGTTDAERAESLVAGLLQAGLATTLEDA